MKCLYYLVRHALTLISLICHGEYLENYTIFFFKLMKWYHIPAQIGLGKKRLTVIRVYHY